MSSARPICLALAIAFGALAADAGAAELAAGNYSFSDELGGFKLVSATGSGSVADPVVLVEEIEDIAPVTLVIRDHQLGDASNPFATPQLTLVKKVVNRSNRIWAGFEMELQEILGTPSDYGDGLSFKQFASEPDDVSSDSFANNQRDFEPSDRIEFLNGHVDPGATGTFKITVTDPTPTPVFYLVQEPKLLSASLPKRRMFARR